MLGTSSRLLQASLPRPLGIVFEEDAVRRRVVVSAFLDGSPAAQLAQVPAPASTGACAALDLANLSRAQPTSQWKSGMLMACSSED